MSANCEMCPILETYNDGKDVQILQTERRRVVLDKNQRFLDKTLVTPLKHEQSLSELDDENWREFHQVVKDFESVICKIFELSNFNWSCFMDMAANGQETRVHWYVRPRYTNKTVVKGGEF